MENSNNSWRSQVSFIASICLHAGAIALIALGPTLVNDYHGNNGAEKVELTVTDAAPKVDVAPTPAPVVPVVAAPAPVVVPQPVQQPAQQPVKPIAAAPAPIKKVAVHKKAAPVAPAPKVETQNSIEPQPVIEAQNSETVVDDNKVEEKIEEAKPEPTEAVAVEKTQEEKPKEEVKAEPVIAPVEEAKAEPVPAQPAPAEKVAEKKTSSAGAPEAVAATPAGVTQNYLGLRQQPGNKPPVYSRDMRMKQMQGTGQLVYFVSKEGTITDLKVTKSTGTPELDQAAVDAFSKYKFVPGQEGYTVHNFEFNLKGPAVSDTGRLRTTMNR